MSRSYSYRHWTKRLAAFGLDTLGNLLTVPWRFSQKPLETRNIKKILAVRLDPLGDVIMTMPAIRALGREFPDWQIDFLTSSECAPLVENFPGIHELLSFKKDWFRHKPSAATWREARLLISELRARRYDLAIDFRGDLRNILLLTLAGIPRRLGYGITGGGFLLTDQEDYAPQEHRILLNFRLLRRLGLKPEIPPVNFPHTLAQEEDFRNRFGQIRSSGNRPRIVMHTSAGYPSKRWPSEKFIALIQKIISEDLGEVVLIGNERETLGGEASFEKEGLTDLRGKTSLRDLGILFEACDLFVGNDSGPAHLAAAQGLSLVILFSGTNDWRLWHPWTQKLKPVYHEVPCSPCHEKICPLGHHDCMKKIEVEEAFEAVKKALAAIEAAERKSKSFSRAEAATP